MLAYSITPVPYKDIHLRLGRVVDPLVIEDVPYSTTKAIMNQQHPFNATIPINIEDVEIPIKISAETQEETLIETQPTQPTREPPYPE